MVNIIFWLYPKFKCYKTVKKNIYTNAESTQNKYLHVLNEVYFDACCPQFSCQIWRLFLQNFGTQRTNHRVGLAQDRRVRALL